jgi:membrane-bound lytic murein transglycosylase D
MPPRWPLSVARTVLALLAVSGCAHRLTQTPRPAPPVPFIPGAPEPAAAHPPPPEPEPEAPTTRPPRLARGEVAEADKPPWMRGLVRPDLPLRWYPRVSRWLEMYRSDPRMREIMRGWLRRVAAHRPVIDEALAREGLPRSLIAVSMIESGLTAGAVSTKAAGGYWQFMPDVARGYGMEVSFWVDERRDLVKSSSAAARYLSDLHHRFGNWELALAGYHAGVFGILQAIVRFNTNDFWTLSQVEAGMPFETTEYVPKVFATAIVERNRAAFGFDPNGGEGPRDSELASAPPGASFEVLAQRLGIRPEELAQLNPIYLRKRTPPDRGPVPLRIPVGKRALAAASWPRAAVMDLVPTKVRGGETLARLARARRLPIDRLRRLNGVADDGEVIPGTTLLLPRPGGSRARQPPKVVVGRR